MSDPPAVRPARVLVVDDEPHIVRLLSYLLQVEGYEVAVAYDGEEALSVAASFAPDGLLLDLQIPKLSGQAVLERLRADPRFAGLKILVLSGCPYQGEPGDDPGARPDERCSKPIAPSTLVRKLRDHGVAPRIPAGVRPA